MPYLGVVALLAQKGKSIREAYDKGLLQSCFPKEDRSSVCSDKEILFFFKNDR